MRKKRLIAAVLALALMLSTFAGSGFASAEERQTMAEAIAENGAEWDTYSDTWALTDELGRTAPSNDEAGGVRGEKKVGVFYLVWHDKLMNIAAGVDDGAPRNITQIIKDNPDSWVYDASLWGPESSMHYWGEPLYGYYNLRYDDWVVRQHAIQLCDAGVDFIVIDATNFFAEGVYNESADDIETIKNICKVYKQMRDEGQKTPQITFLTTWNEQYNAMSANFFYENLYTNPDWDDLWFQYDGKPLMMGSPTFMPDELKDFFTYRRVQPELSEAGGGSWNWLAKFPQEIGYTGDNVKECMAVGVAQNWSESLQFMSSVDEYGRFTSRGRSWTSANHKLLTDPISEEYNSKYGYNFQEQFDRAHNLDPDLIFVTAWNEWIAGRFAKVPDWAGGGSLPNRANFGDDFTTEFSREIEMTREGGLNDNFYNQLTENIRWFKGVRKAPNYKSVKTVGIDGDFADWDSVPSYYRDSLNDTAIRDAKGVGNLEYKYDTGRNDFKQFKVSRDDKNLYFYAETVGNISAFTEKNWMTLFLSTGSEKNWAGYDYAVNRSGITSDKTTLERSKGGKDWERVCDLSYKVSGSRMELAVPLNQIGMSADDCKFTFKWMDNMQVDGDALEFYISGDAAPNARFSYVYEEKETASTAGTYQSMYNMTDTAESIVLSGTDTAGMRFRSDYDFRGIDIAAYNLFNSAADYTVSLYRFQDSYGSSVGAAPIATKRVENVYNNTPIYLGADLIPAGDYLLVVSDVKTKDEENICGLYLYENQEGTTSYYNGQLIGGIFRTRIWYAPPVAMGGFSVTASSGDASGLAGAGTIWQSGMFDENDGSQYLTIDLGSVRDVAGISLTPNLENGFASCFPRAFTILASEDGETWNRVLNQGYQNYSATASEQVFDFNAKLKTRYLRIRFDELAQADGKYTAQLAGVSVRGYSSDAAFANNSGNTALFVTIGVCAGVGIAAGIIAIILIRRKKHV